MIRVIIEREIAEGLESYYESAVFNLLGVFLVTTLFLALATPIFGIKW